MTNNKIPPERVQSFRVTYQERQLLISLKDPGKKDWHLMAIQEAARQWELPWQKIAAYCEVAPFETIWRCTCIKCGKKFGVPTAATAATASECPICTKKRQEAMAEYVRRHPVDRRINANIDGR